MTYEQALNYILSFPRFGKSGDSSRIGKLLKLLGNPHKKLKFIHVAGTNGKGSVCALLSAALSAMGYQTGLFISPFITDFRERVQINGTLVSRELLTKAAEKIKACAYKVCPDGGFCSFEIITAAAFLCFEAKKCDIVVLETGVGGLHDCTNIIDPPVCSVLTTISLDHTQILGNTVCEIAREKCGIIKKNSHVVSAAQSKEAENEIIKAAAGQNCTLNFSSEITLQEVKHSFEGISYLYSGQRITQKLIGVFQEENAKTALKTLEVISDCGFKTDIGAVARGFGNAVNPARFEILGTNPPLILDGAHNPNGLEALGRSLQTYLGGRKAIGLIAMLGDKDFQNGISVLKDVLDCVYLTEVENNLRTLSAEELFGSTDGIFPRVYCEQNMRAAFDKAYALCKKENRPLVVCGSLYLASRLRPYIIQTAGNTQV